MKIQPDLAGIRLKSYQTGINWRDTTNYAASIQDNNPKYFDDRSGQGLVAHPMFAVSATWPILSRLDNFIDSESFPEEVLLTQVHYSEHLILNRLSKPGDKLKISGRIIAFLPHRAGTHAIIRLDAADENAAPVFTEYVGAMLRGVDCGQGGQSEQLPLIPEAGEPAGQEGIWRSVIHIDPLQPYIYDGCSNIEFAIHTSPGFAEAVGLPGIILQGTATLAYAVREIVNNEADGDPDRVAEIACRFTGMVLPGTDIIVICTEKHSCRDHTDIFFEVRNSENKRAVRNGYMKLRRGKNG